MKKLIRKFFERTPENLIGIAQGRNSRKFVLSYGPNEVGYLKHIDGNWIFAYSDWFKGQDQLLPLIEFPQKGHIYRSKELWPFFSSRIPSNKQPKFRQLDKEGRLSLDQLLETFGKHSINNPFTLEVR